MNEATARTRSSTKEALPDDRERPRDRSAEAEDGHLRGWEPSAAGISQGIGSATEGWSTLMAVQQRNLAACMLANQRLMEATQLAFQQELRLLERSMQDVVARSREIMAEPDPARRIEQRLALQRRCLEEMLGNAQHLYDLLAKPQLEALEILSRRALASMEELSSGQSPDA